MLLCNSYSQIFWSRIDGPYGGDIHDIHITSNGYVFISTNNGIFRSIDNGNSWRSSNLGTYGSSTILTGNSHDELYMISPGGSIFNSVNYGNTWREINQDMGVSELTALSVDKNNYVYAATSRDVYLSKDNGSSWQLIADRLADGIIDIAVYDSNYVYVISDEDGIFRTIDYGETWYTMNEGLESDDVEAIAIMKNGLIIVGVSNDVYVSDDLGLYWQKRYDDLSNGQISTIHIDNLDHIYLGTNHGRLYFSPDSGSSWDLLSGHFYIDEITCVMNKNADSIFVGTSPSGVLFTNNHGVSWEYINQDITNLYSTAVLIDSSNRIYLGTYEGIFRSDSQGENWEAINQGLSKSDFGYLVIALDQSLSGEIFAASYTGISILDKETDTWRNLGGFDCSSLYINDSSYIYIGVFGTGIYRSTNYGESWEHVYPTDGSFIDRVGAFTENSSQDLFACSSDGILKSTDHGMNWEVINTQLTVYGGSSISCSSGNILYAREYSKGVFRSEDSGVTWLLIDDNLGSSNILSLISNTTGQTFLCDWSVSGGVFKITDNLDYWTNVNNGLTSTEVSCLAFDKNEYLYVGTTDGLLFRSNETTTGLSSKVNEVPEYFELKQNYPNPFNPSTRIDYYLNTSGKVKLRVIDINGRVVRILIDSFLQAGKYSVNFSKENLSSGVYFYELSLNGLSKYNKMILIE
jgi:photosystem II stability/assembly factor-like uncharacterized protein